MCSLTARRYARDVKAGETVQVMGADGGSVSQDLVKDVWIAYASGAFNPYVRVSEVGKPPPCTLIA